MVELNKHKIGKTLTDKINEAFKDSEVTNKDKYGFTKKKGEVLDYENPAHRLYAWSEIYQDEEGVMGDLVSEIRKAFKGSTKVEEGKVEPGAFQHAITKAQKIIKDKKLIRLTSKKDAEEILDEYIHHVLNSLYADKLDSIIKELKKQAGDDKYDEDLLKDLKRDLYDKAVGAGQVKGVRGFKELRRALMFRKASGVESELEKEVEAAIQGHTQVLSGRLSSKYILPDDVTYMADRLNDIHKDHVHPDVLNSMDSHELAAFYTHTLKGEGPEKLGFIHKDKYKGKK